MASPLRYNRARRACVALLAAVAVFFSWTSPSASRNDAATYTAITWEQLTPESWHRENSFGELNPDGLSDNDPVAAKALETYLAKWEDAPANGALQGKHVKICGFVVPLEWENKSSLKEFLLVPYFGACIHVPPPPQNQIIHVESRSALQGVQSMDPVVVYGKISIAESSNSIADSVYHMEADHVETDNKNMASNMLHAMSVTLLCGLSLCFCLLFFYKIKNFGLRVICFSISFSSGIMSCAGISTLFMKPTLDAVSSFIISFVFISAVVHLLHARSKKDNFDERMRQSGKFASLAVAAHGLPEYFAVFSAAMLEPALGLALGAAVVAHNIPLGASVAFLVHQGTGKRGLAWLCLSLSGFIPAAAAISLHLSVRSFLPANLETLFACAGGIMTSVAVTDLIPLAGRHGRYAHVLRGYCAGVLFMLLLLLFFYRENGNVM
ncbi:MAG: DUF3299 domain-containing protein [Desulfovibrio sp.]|jgi:zinc transporter ZupT|nr:DUF3299 domain-containing protein [Desulfovibrio sp.]